MEARCIVQKSHPSSKLGVIGATPSSPHPEMWHLAESLCKSKQSDVGMSMCYTVLQ